MIGRTGRNGLSRFGGVAFIVSGALFFTRSVLDVMSGPPPSTGAEILSWAQANRVVLSLVSEVLFFAAMFLVPAVIALYRSLESGERTLASVGCGLMAAVIPVLAVLLVVHGRLVYPVYGLRISDPAVAESVVALYYGGLHAVGLLMAVATAVLSLAMWRGAFGAPVAALGFATAVCDVVGSYPYLISTAVLFGCQLMFAAWFVAVGWKLLRGHEQDRKSTGAASTSSRRRGPGSRITRPRN